jgi:small subunit ribosomal protein S8
MTYVTDPIGDMLTRMRNAQHARKDECSMPWSRLREQILTLLKKEDWIADFSVTGAAPFQEITVVFAEEKQKLELKRISKPGRRVYTGHKDMKPVLQGFGMAIVTTSKGLMTDSQARQEQVGGEILCTIS